jgi:hypothetical protein
MTDKAMWEGFPLARAAVEATEPLPIEDDEEEPRIGNRLLRLYAEQGRITEIAPGVYIASKLGGEPLIG